MYKCNDCGEEFENGADGCPECGCDDYYRLCVNCGDYHVTDGLCDKCAEHFATDYETLKKASNRCKGEKVLIPELAAAVLTEDEIKTALFRYIEKEKINCRAFIEGDRAWFADFLESEGV